MILIDAINHIARRWTATLSFYVDDATVEDEGSDTRHTLAQVSGATQALIEYFETQLCMPVSAAKSMAIADKLSTARRISNIGAKRLRPQRHGKLLGAPSGGRQAPQHHRAEVAP